ncbi:MAG TPA: TlpA disulfide reductase family protein [Thermoanaerobaculia bacterium]
MRVRKLAGAVPCLAAAAALWLLAAAPVPRKAPAFAYVDAAGREVQLSSFKGKVVVVELLLIRCPHCWRLAQTIAKLHQELGARGLQPISIAFDNDASGPLVRDFAANAKIGYPVGYTTADKVDGFLGREAKERFQVPQLVVIDRAGVIRAQSSPTGEVKLEDEASLRRLLDGLLREAAP